MRFSSFTDTVTLTAILWFSTVLLRTVDCLPTSPSSAPSNSWRNATTNSTTSSTSTCALPIIDLGYARHRATSYNAAGSYFVFKNIRFAAPPSRFRPPEPPVSGDGYDDGELTVNEGAMCHQAFNLQFKIVDYTQVGKKQSEDCLFVDIYVPASVFCDGGASKGFNRTRAAGEDGAHGLPVLVWIYGGGFTFGFKDGVYDPHGLVNVAQGKMIYAAISYRIGAFGFLPPVAGNEGGTNLGLLDQRMGLDWIAKYIDRFGGDAAQVTVLGESAGGSSILHHLTAGDGGEPADVPFKRAIIQSTAYYPQYDAAMLETQYREFLQVAGCASSQGDDDATDAGLPCLLALDEKTLAQANKDYVFSARWGTFQFGPYIDNSYVQDLPQFQLPLSHHKRSNVELMIGYNLREGAMFVDPSTHTERQVNRLIDLTFPNASSEAIEHAKSLYPQRKSVWAWASEVIAEWAVSCYSLYLDDVYESVYLYQFAIPPGTHSVDLPFTFWRGTDDPSLPSLSAEAAALADAGSAEDGIEAFFSDQALKPGMQDIARHFQEYLVSFAIYGDPNILSTSGVEFPPTSSCSTQQPLPEKEGAGKPVMLQIHKKGFKHLAVDEFGPNRERCAFWQNKWWTGRE